MPNRLKLTTDDVDYVDDRDSAARLLLELKAQLAEDQREQRRGSAQQTQRAINKLTAAWPDANDHAATAADHELGGLHPELRKTRDAHRRDRGHTAGSARNARRRGAHPATPAKEPTGDRAGGQHGAGGGSRAPSRPARPLFGGAGRRAWRDTGVPAAAASWRDVGLQVIGFGVLASLGYVLLTDAENPARGWPSVVQTFFGSLSTAVRAIVAPVDPLRPHSSAPQTAAQKQAAAKSAAARQRAATAATAAGTRLAGYPDSHPVSRAPLFTNPLTVPSIGGTP